MNLRQIVLTFASALFAGAGAPEFQADSHDGRKINLSVLYGKGPVVLVFIRGFG